ncbi:MAG: hypothetical protein HRT44_04340, partial [Bdellovibrionales bacterium]|nr:hypothetical protein [Bdellovibrionales bacterium]NQZ18473.1 hypothetical protein [Bdellovibrionales bacterium]
MSPVQSEINECLQGDGMQVTARKSKKKKTPLKSKAKSKKKKVVKKTTAKKKKKTQAKKKTTKKKTATKAKSKAKTRQKVLGKKTKLDKSLLLKMYDLMVQSRVLEERMIQVYRKGGAYFWIGAPGEEAFGVP